jgi:hypothetical protein
MKTQYFKFILLIQLFVLVSLSGCSEITNTNSDFWFKFFDLYPNPVSSHGSISYNISDEMPLSLTIADNYGREIIRLLDNQIQTKGFNTLNIDFSKFPSGAYSLIMTAGDYTVIKEFTVIK